MGEYRELKAWRAAHELALGVYRVTAAWPAAERFGLISQVRRAAFSVPVNIVEGARRRGSREFRRFLDIALGSLAEVRYTIEFAAAVGVGKEDDARVLTPLVEEADKLCFGLARSLDRALRRA
jgi:four helix bundle protein